MGRAGPHPHRPGRLLQRSEGPHCHSVVRTLPAPLPTPRAPGEAPLDGSSAARAAPSTAPPTPAPASRRTSSPVLARPLLASFRKRAHWPQYPPHSPARRPGGRLRLQIPVYGDSPAPEDTPWGIPLSHQPPASEQPPPLHIPGRPVCLSYGMEGVRSRKTHSKRGVESRFL